MKKLILNIKNLLPYLLLILIYFFFVNIEAKNDLNRKVENNKSNLNRKETIGFGSDVNDRSNTISIPVIPYYK